MEKLTIEELDFLTAIRNEKGVEVVEVMNDQELSRYRINCMEAIERNEEYILNGACEALKKVKKENNEKLQEYITYIDEKVNKKDNLTVIDKFLNNWKERAFNFYVDSKKTLDEIRNIKLYLAEAKEKGLKGFDRDKYVSNRKISETQRYFANFSKHEIAILRANNFLDNLKNTLEFMVMEKKIHLINRVKKVAGNILDASGLYLGDNGAINGKIVGEQSTVNVRTVYAGGYIQCLHYRVLVKES